MVVETSSPLKGRQGCVGFLEVDASKVETYSRNF